MDTPDDHRRARIQGKSTALGLLTNAARCGALPAPILESYAEGFAEGVREFVGAYVSDRAAYELLQRAADRVTVDKVSKAGEVS